MRGELCPYIFKTTMNRFCNFAYAVNQEIAKGQDNFVLCSSPEAERIYEKLGFVHENNLFQRQRKMGVPG